MFSFENPEAALRIMWELHPESKPPAVSGEAVRRRDLEVLKSCLEPMRIDAGDPDPRWCATPAPEMRAWQELLQRSGALRQKSQCASRKDRLACRAASRGSLFGSV